VTEKEIKNGAKNGYCETPGTEIQEKGKQKCILHVFG
jgi:hypothetical protein